MDRKSFIDLRESSIATDSGIFIQDKTFKRERKTIASNVSILDFKGVPFYVKDIYGKYSVQAMCASKMYNDLGMINPPLFPIFRQGDVSKLAMISQDVRSIDDIFAEHLTKIPEFKSVKSRLVLTDYYYNKWDYLLDKNVKRWCLTFMTEECYNQILDMSVLDELRTEKDRGIGNFFLYKNPGSQVYDGVIVIDLDLVHVLECQTPSNKKDFYNFLDQQSYFTFNPLGGIDKSLTYSERILALKSCYDNGRLPKRQCDLINACLGYDFPKTIRNMCKSSYLKKYSAKLYEPYSRLWEFNSRVFGV